MCCRYYFDPELDEYIAGKYELPVDAVGTGVKRDIHPSDKSLVILRKEGKTACESMKWGMTSPKGSLVINARRESLFEKNMFRENIISKRCVIPASGFYEWDRHKNRYSFYTDGPLFMAGLYTDYTFPSFAVITTDANLSIADVHDRMPFILSEEEIEPWINDVKSIEAILSKLQPELKRYAPVRQSSLLDEL